MCGCKISGMKRKKINQKTMTAALINAGLGLGGFLAAKLIKNKVSYLKDNPAIGGGVAIGLGLVLSTQGGTAANIGNGMMASGGQDLLKALVPSFEESISGVGAPMYNRSANQHRVAGANRSTTLHNVAGARSFEVPTIKVP